MVTFIKGNEAVVIGALYAGCELYFGYPITPASEVAHAAARHFPATGRVFLQSECETASISMVYGAGCAGRASMTASSGPGISLMQEGISYMAGGEVPGVIVNVQRAGPGLGNIFPEQADYNQAVKGGGHGNYHCIVLAPGDVQEMCDLTIKAFELSFKYRNPAIVLTDAVLGQMMESIRIPEGGPVVPDASSYGVQASAATRKNFHTSIFMDARAEEEVNKRLERKYASMSSDALCEEYMVEDADVLICAYGSSSRVARSAVDALREAGVKAGLWRPLTLFPFPLDSLERSAEGRAILVAELSNGQFRDDIAAQLGRKRSALGFVNKMGGVLLSVGDVVGAAEAALEGAIR
jgi:2-oxoisovalerate ferredoxin oxidoreductase alpha subunit